MTIVGTVVSFAVMAVATATAVTVYELEQRKVSLRGDILDLSIEAQVAFLERCGTISSPVTLASTDWQTSVVIDYGLPANWNIVLTTNGGTVNFTSNEISQVAYVAAKTGGVVTGNTVSVEVDTPDYSDVPDFVEFKFYAQGLSHCNN